MADRIGYLVSQYPALSHSFIFREICELRSLGLPIHVASVLSPDRPAGRLSAEERSEFESTYYIRAALNRWPALHLQTFLERPGAYLRGLAAAVRLARGDIPRTLRHLRFFGEAIVAGQWFRSRGVAHIHTHFASLTALLVNRVFATSFSITIHGSDEFIDPAGFSMAEKVRAARLLIGISRYGCSQIMRFSSPEDWGKVAMVRLGIDPRAFHPAPKTAQPGAVFRVICVGRLVPVKAYRFLIRAVWQLAERGHPVHLTIIGGGPDRTDLQHFAESLGAGALVEFTGPLPNETVRARVAAADCFALASFAEGVPVVLMEAMALEIPCVATRVTGVPELIEDGREGLLVPPADAAALAGALERLLLDPELRRAIARKGRAKVLADYDLRPNVAELLVRFKKL